MHRYRHRKDGWSFGGALQLENRLALPNNEWPLKRDLYRTRSIRSAYRRGDCTHGAYWSTSAKPSQTPGPHIAAIEVVPLPLTKRFPASGSSQSNSHQRARLMHFVREGPDCLLQNCPSQVSHPSVSEQAASSLALSCVSHPRTPSIRRRPVEPCPGSLPNSVSVSRSPWAVQLPHN